MSHYFNDSNHKSMKPMKYLINNVILSYSRVKKYHSQHVVLPNNIRNLFEFIPQLQTPGLCHDDSYYVTGGVVDTDWC